MSLFVLDTDTLSLYQRGDPNVNQQANSRPRTELAITVINVEEQLTGWYSLLRRAKKPEEVANVYQRLADAVHSLAGLQILSYTVADIQRYEQLRGMKLNVGKMDLRVAAIVL